MTLDFARRCHWPRGWFATSTAHAEVRIGAAGPLTGSMAWFGEQHERGVAMAVAEINEAGGLLGQSVEVVLADDYCEAEQGVAAARKLIAAGVVFVAGHLCSGAAIPASATVPGGRHHHDLRYRDQPETDRAGLLATCFGWSIGIPSRPGLPATTWRSSGPNARIAIVHDGTVYGQDLGRGDQEAAQSARR